MHVEPRQGIGPGTWTAIFVIAVFVVAATVWGGLSASNVYSGTAAQEQQARRAVQTPGGGGAGTNLVNVPSFAAWAPGTLIQTTDHYPRAGESFTAESCTVAFSFSDAAGRNYAVTAGHCGHDGDLVWPANAETAQDYAREAGRFMYSGLYSAGAPGIDVGIIEITDPDRFMPLVGDPIATGVAQSADSSPGRVCKTGGTTGYTCGQFRESSRVQIITTDSDQELEARGDVAAVCASKGDSGGPVFREVNGRAVIIGAVSGTEAGRSGEECHEGMDNPKLMSYSNVDQIMRVVDAVAPDASWVTQTW
ncbi:Trypsin [Corynebacterium capitovis DSM 44611]|uniref:trypsin-like serine protease n=1 Tax=Corynebacterium capitovis TaxID=131081 RepID=UPI000361A949|nr:trypsin-like serine protease [Corynebacterium capitovis]WKD57306.1 Trypsin [Corynebacterium capitovis DSM 44611]